MFQRFKPFHSRLLGLVAVLLLGPTAQGGTPITQGVVDYAVTYEEVGPMAAMMPKAERVFFRPGQVRIESGQNVTLLGVEDGSRIQLMELGELKVAFVMPHDETADEHEALRFEVLQETRSVAGREAFRVDGVDREDDSNRLPYWLSREIQADWRVLDGLPDGFPLDYTVIFDEGLAKKVATTVEARELPDDHFVVPEGFRRIEVESAREIGDHLRELLGAEVQVMD